MRGTGETEKKQLAPFPEFSVEALLDGSYGKDGIKPYLTDHFPMRDFFVGVNAYAVLAEGVNGENGVYNCADGYLINKPISADNHIEYNLFILDDFKNYCLKEKGVDVPMTAMFVPSTGFIMENKLPLLHDVYNDEAFFAQFTDALSESGIGFVDIRGAFQRPTTTGRQRAPTPPIWSFASRRVCSLPSAAASTWRNTTASTAPPTPPAAFC